MNCDVTNRDFVKLLDLLAVDCKTVGFFSSKSVKKSVKRSV